MRLKRHVNPIWYFTLALICVEFILFRSYLAHNIEGFFPFSFDQADYLQLSYKLYENIKEQGFFTGIANSSMLHNGILFPFQAVLLFFLFGVSRSSALLLNFIYFAILQLFVVYTASTVTRKNYLALLFLGLVLCINTPFYYAGNMLDFRMDFLAFCLYGIWVCAILKSRLFLDRKWSLIAGLIAALLVLSRFITLVYIAPIMGCLLVYFAFVLYRKETSASMRILNLLLSSLVIIICITPYLWLSKEYIYHYYVSTHVKGSEKYIRTQEVGINHIFDYITFYPHSLLITHLGRTILYFSALLLTIFLFLYFKSRKPHYKDTTTWQFGFVFLILSTCLPLAILTIDISKSNVVGSIAAIPFLWLFIYTLTYFDSRILLSRRAQTLLMSVTASVLFFGLFNQVHELTHLNSSNKQRDLTTITQMYQDIGDYALNKKWERIHLSVDRVVDFLTHSSLNTVYYETRHIQLNASLEKMGNTIFDIKKEEVLDSLKKSNVVILNVNEYQESSPYPFNTAIAALKPMIQNYTEKHMKRLGDYPMQDTVFRVYVSKE